MDFGDMIPIVLFLTIGTVLGLYAYFRHRQGLALQETVRMALERGQDLTPEVLEALAGDRGGQRDLRRGLVWIAVALGVVSLGVSVDEQALYGIAAFPGFVGLAYLVLWWVASRRA